MSEMHLKLWTDDHGTDERTGSGRLEPPACTWRTRGRIHRLLLISALGAGAVSVGSRSLAGKPALTQVRVSIRDQAGDPLPARLTVLDHSGKMAPIHAEPTRWLAVRPGVIYTGTGEAAFRLPSGKFTLHVNRGPEYGLATRTLDLRESELALTVRLPREVDSRGFISADTHIHTRTYSGHGDATIDERMATIAGEGIELAVATDHNHHTDYAPVARETGSAPFFTPVIGNEVTTKTGHFNAFPIRAGSRPPDFNTADWARLLTDIRATPGVRVITLNHPADNHSGFVPTDPKRFHPASGESRDGRPWDIDAIEVVTSAALQSDWMRPYRDWFAMLNRGRTTVGIGASDTHDVNRFILGQARTYIASRATRPDQIDIQEACDSILAGRVLVSMGLFTELWVDERFAVGDLSTSQAPLMKLRVRVQGPKWIDADRVDLYVNGQKSVSRPIAPADRGVVKADLILSLPRPRHDAWIVAIASGPGADVPYWPAGRPYQPDRADWDPKVIGSTSPIRIDGDGDGVYTSPLDQARRAIGLAKMGEVPSAADLARLAGILERSDSAVTIQATSLLFQRGLDLMSAPARGAFENAAPHVRHGFVAYRNLLRE